MTKSKPKAAIYARISDKKDETDTIADQLALCRQAATRAGYRVIAEYADDGVSGTVPLEKRRGGGRALSDLQVGRVDVVFVKDGSRLGRGIGLEAGMVTRLLAQYGDGIRYAMGKAPDVTELGGFAQSMAEEIAHAIHVLRTRKAVRLKHHELWSKGHLGQGQVPYGVTWDKKKKRWGVDPARVAVVRQIYERYVKGDGCQTISDALNKKKVPLPEVSGNGRVPTRWHSTTIGKIIRNPKYVGNFPAYRGEYLIRNPKAPELDRWPNAQVVERTDYPILIPPPLWAKAQTIREARMDRREPAGRMHRARAVRDIPGVDGFRGRVLCAECGLRFHRRSDTYRGNSSFYYKCWGRERRSVSVGWLKKRDFPCPNETRITESVLYAHLVDLLSNPHAMAEAIAVRMAEVDKAVLQLQAELGPVAEDKKALEQRRRQLLRMVKAGALSDEQLEAELGELEEATRRLRVIVKCCGSRANQAASLSAVDLLSIPSSNRTPA
jgi:DNA invertase Pin-like site-specific DNA recombinase